MRHIHLLAELPKCPIVGLLISLIAGVYVFGQQGFVLADSLTSILNGHVGKLPDGQAFLPTHVAVPMLEELAAAFTDPQFQANAISIGVFCFTAFSDGIVGLKCLDGSLGERKSFAHGGLL